MLASSQLRRRRSVFSLDLGTSHSWEIRKVVKQKTVQELQTVSLLEVTGDREFILLVTCHEELWSS